MDRGAPVFTRSFRSGPPWVPASVSGPTSSASSEVALQDGTVWQRHGDHIRPNLAPSPPPANTEPLDQPAEQQATEPVEPADAAAQPEQPLKPVPQQNWAATTSFAIGRKSCSTAKKCPYKTACEPIFSITRTKEEECDD
ncbi:hypothetical protein MTO96_026661 [Rhipicephalus appendiculatus]